MKTVNVMTDDYWVIFLSGLSRLCLDVYQIGHLEPENVSADTELLLS